MASAYSDEQLAKYCARISLPQKYHHAAKPPLNLDLLHALHVFQISAIPYENLSLHYSSTLTPSLDPQDLFEKLVASGCRGGYCMENSTFFLHILLAYGFDVYPVGVRVRLRRDGVPYGMYSGWAHMANIVTLDDGERYMIDVSFGGDGATKPLPLRHGVVTSNLGPQEVRLIHDYIEPQIRKDQKLWIYQYRNSVDASWNSFFAFSDAVEFLPNDFSVMNYFTSTASFQAYTVLVVSFLRKEYENVICGKKMVVDSDIKQNLGGKTTLIMKCYTEQERVEALREHFGIILNEEEIQAIRGKSTQLALELN